MPGLRERVRSGELTPDEALSWLSRRKLTSKKIVPWLQRQKKNHAEATRKREQKQKAADDRLARKKKQGKKVNR